MPSSNATGFDPVWEERYQDPAYRNKYPWSSVVTFVFRNWPRRADPSIVEVGCGNGSNLWFAAREGFRTAGIDGSKTAIEYAREWFARDGLQADFRVGDFASLPFPDGDFDLAIDRGALTLGGVETVTSALAELHRVLRPGGRLLFNPFSDRCSSFDGLPDADGCYRKISKGSINSKTHMRFYGLNDVRDALKGWTIRSLEHHERTEFLRAERVVHAEWLAIAEKT